HLTRSPTPTVLSLGGWCARSAGAARSARQSAVPNGGTVMGSVRDFIVNHYRHFNAATVVDAARAWEELLEKGGKMLLTMAGAMSTAELGTVIAELLRRDMVHLLSCTGANLEEDVFNLVAHDSYVRIPNYRDL